MAAPAAAETFVEPLSKLTANNYVSIVQTTIKRKTGKLIDNVRIFSPSITELPKTNGFMGEYYKVQVTMQPNKYCSDIGTSFNYFVKTLPLYNPILMEIMRDTGMADREQKTYTTLFTALDGLPKKISEPKKSWHPYCYFRNEDLLILEDLEGEGYEHASDKWNFSVQQCDAVLGALADMHASSLAYEHLVLNGSTLNEIHSDLLTETSFVKNNSWFVVGLETIAEMVPLLPNFEKDFAERWNRKSFMEHVEGIYEVIKPSNIFRNVLTHQDLWTSNILFQQPQEPNILMHAKLIDFQCMRYLPPAADISLLLHLTTRRTHRKDNFAQHLTSYYAHFSHHLSDYGLDANTVLPFEELRESCSALRLLALINACILLPWIRMPDNAIHKLKANNYKIYEQIAYVRRIDYIVEHIKNDPIYRQVVEDVVCEMVEWVYEQKTYFNK